MATQTHQFFTDRSKSPHNPSQLVSSSPYYKDPAEFTVHTQKHRSFCQATATVGAKSLVLLPVTVLEIEAGFRKVGALLPCGTRSPQAHRYPRPSRHVPPLTQHCIPPRADGSTAPHGLQPHCFAFLYQAPPAQRRGAHGDALARDARHALLPALARAGIGRRPHGPEAQRDPSTTRSAPSPRATKNLGGPTTSRRAEVADSPTTTESRARTEST